MSPDFLTSGADVNGDHYVGAEEAAYIMQVLAGTRYENHAPELDAIGPRTVVEGGTSLRFSPKYPQFLPQFSAVDDILKNSQRYFYALNMVNWSDHFESQDKTTDDATLTKLEIDDASDKRGGSDHQP